VEGYPISCKNGRREYSFWNNKNNNRKTTLKMPENQALFHAF
jgi:hypothetical protein